MRILMITGAMLAAGASGATLVLPALGSGSASNGMEQAAARENRDIIDLEPLVVSIATAPRSVGAIPRLRLSISVELESGVYGDGTRQRLRHAFIAGIQRLDVAMLRGSDGLAVLRQTLRDAAGEALGGEVHDVFITEFILL